MLSELAKAAAREIINKENTISEDNEYGLIFPYSENKSDFEPGSDYSVSNKLYAIVSDPYVFDIESAV